VGIPSFSPDIILRLALGGGYPNSTKFGRERWRKKKENVTEKACEFEAIILR
jgi:hypothetical protein